MIKLPLRLVPPTTENRTVTPTRRPNADYRTREHLTQAEVERLIKAAGKNRWGHRDATMVLVAFRHGLRASELTDLRWDQIDFNAATLHVRRVKKGTPATHPIRGDELRALRRLQREQNPSSPFVFTSERGCAVHYRWLRAHDRASWRNRQAGLQGPPPHVEARHGLRPGQCGA